MKSTLRARQIRISKGVRRFRRSADPRARQSLLTLQTVKCDRWLEIAGRVFARDHCSLALNVGIVIGADGVLVVDA